MAGTRIARKAVEAFISGRRLKPGANDTVTVENNTVRYLLFGNEIARREGQDLTIQDAGWRTASTRGRLNILLQACNHPHGIVQKKGVWLLGPQEWPGEMKVQCKTASAVPAEVQRGRAKVPLPRPPPPTAISVDLSKVPSSDPLAFTTGFMDGLHGKTLRTMMSAPGELAPEYLRGHREGRRARQTGQMPGETPAPQLGPMVPP